MQAADKNYSSNRYKISNRLNLTDNGITTIKLNNVGLYSFRVQYQAIVQLQFDQNRYHGL